jgi:hypothetical protein
MEALTKHIAHKVATGKESLVHREAVRETFREAMSQRISPMIMSVIRVFGTGLPLN